MKLFDVYPLMPINIVKAENCKLWDENGTEYLDFYGGHAVISVGHTHPHYVEKIKNQLDQIGFYSNSVINKLQEELAEKLGKISGYEDYSLFLCNSGAESNENALKIASFTSGKKKFITFKNSFHGRTSAVVAATDDPSIVAPVNETSNFIFCEWNNVEQFEKLFLENLQDLAGVIIEGIQGIGGIQIPSQELMTKISELCAENSVFFISDVQGVKLNGGFKPSLNKKEILKGIETGEISGGMIPKLKSCMDLLNKGINKVWIGSGMLDITNQTGGTWVVHHK
ncbi:MAG: aminotransferase class III-fold pyridoxal phosphate-dependent enzyme [Kaistella sp.]